MTEQATKQVTEDAVRNRNRHRQLFPASPGTSEHHCARSQRSIPLRFTRPLHPPGQLVVPIEGANPSASSQHKKCLIPILRPWQLTCISTTWPLADAEWGEDKRGHRAHHTSLPARTVQESDGEEVRRQCQLPGHQPSSGPIVSLLTHMTDTTIGHSKLQHSSIRSTTLIHSFPSHWRQAATAEEQSTTPQSSLLLLRFSDLCSCLLLNVLL